MEKVRLDALLVTRGLVDTRTRARQAIIEGKIAVDGEVQLRPGVRVDPGALISVVSPLMHYVSRGALKLQAALDGFGIAVAGRVALDVGASTGGFTQLLLERGAARVYAVDVGRGQLHDILRSDPRVVAMEDTDIRQLRAELLSPRPSLVTVDVSFISLRLVLPSICRLARDGSDVVALVKPQFEVGPGGVGKGGIVRDPKRREDAVEQVLAAAESLGYAVRGRLDSPIRGGDGNQEYLVHLVSPMCGERGDEGRESER